jgi:hypothetical protein
MPKLLLAALGLGLLMARPAVAQPSWGLYITVRHGALESNDLAVVDPDAGLLSPIAGLGTGHTIWELAYDEGRDELSGMTLDGDLYVIDRRTGDVSLIASLHDGIFTGLESVPATGKLFATTQTTLYAIDRALGVSTGTAALSLFDTPLQAVPRGLAYDSTHETMFIGLEGMQNGENVTGLGTLNTATGAISFVGRYKIAGGGPFLLDVRAIAYDPVHDRIIGANFVPRDRSDLYVIDRATGEVAFLSSVTTADIITGAVFAPIPGTGPTPTETPRPPTPPLTPTSTATPIGCLGDCDGNGEVQINELISGVAIALGNLSLSVCSAADGDASGAVEIFELIKAVNNALAGCSPSPAG